MYQQDKKRLDTSKNYAKELENKIALFPGTLTEYERFRGYEVEIIDTNKKEKGVNYKELTDEYINNNEETTRLRTHMLSNNIEAILVKGFKTRSSLFDGKVHAEPYGLPVKKKDLKPEEKT